MLHPATKIHQHFHTVLLPPHSYLSGDAFYGDGKLQSFNPLFPSGGYFGVASIIGPANMVDVHPSLSFELTKKLVFETDYDIFWRYSNLRNKQPMLKAGPWMLVP